MSILFLNIMNYFDYLVIVGLMLLGFVIYINWNKIVSIIFPKRDLTKGVQVCPRCGSENIQSSKLSKLGDPIKIQGMVGWDCLNCGYTGRDFMIVNKKSIENKYIKSKKKTFT